MDWTSSLVGGAIGFLSSLGIMTADRIWDRAGKLKIYYTLWDPEAAENPLKRPGFTVCGPGAELSHLSFIFPLTLEIQNTSNTSRVLRDTKITLYNHGVFVDEMRQVRSIRTETARRTETENLGDNKNSYSFVIPPRSIQTEKCVFQYYLERQETNQHIFDEVRFRYFDEHDVEREYHVMYIENCWQLGDICAEDKWTRLGAKKSYQKKDSDNGEIIPFTPEKISYLQMIQEPISRMSNISAIMKGFSAAMTGVVATLLELEVSCWLLLMVSIPLFMFACLDIYYLKLEKRYRYLYECVRTDQHAVDFSMKLSKDNRKAKSRVIDCLKSTSIWLFYLVLFAALAAIIYLKWKGII